MNLKMISVLVWIMVSSFAWGQKMVFIVNAANPTTRITKEQVQDFFLKRSRQWPDGTPVKFFDREESDLRSSFIREYINQTSRQLDQHWIGRKLYSGDSAPTQVSSDALVISLVSRFTGGIGYVSASPEGVVGVKSLEIVGE